MNVLARPVRGLGIKIKVKALGGGGGGGGGGARKTVWTPSSNIVELNERITNLLSK